MLQYQNLPKGRNRLFWVFGTLKSFRYCSMNYFISGKATLKALRKFLLLMLVPFSVAIQLHLLICCNPKTPSGFLFWQLFHSAIFPYPETNFVNSINSLVLSCSGRRVKISLFPTSGFSIIYCFREFLSVFRR